MKRNRFTPRSFRWLFVLLAVTYLLSAIIPLSKADHWLVRVFDFPRLQLALFGLSLLALAPFAPTLRRTRWTVAVLTLGGLMLDAYRIVPYMPFFKKEVLPATAAPGTLRLRILAVNVLQSNRDYERLLRLIDDQDPDLLVLSEVDEHWLENLSPINGRFQHRLTRPQDNTYGLALFSKLELVEAEIRYLVSESVPSLWAVLNVNGHLVELICLHPEPPVPTKETMSTKRDAELIIVAKSTRGATRPTIVIGDLNDVAWSHTTRLFKRVSGLVDPRIGRGVFPTFPATIPMLRIPLDHIFHSPTIKLAQLEVLDAIGSDHLPLLAVLELGREERLANPPPPSLDQEDVDEAREILRKAD